MRSWSFATGFAVCIAAFAGAALAKEQAERAFTEAISLCTAALLGKPDQFAKAWLDAGFTLAPAQAITPNWFSTGFTRDSTTLTLIELKFSTQQSTTCQYTAPVSVSLDNAKALGAILVKDGNLGPMEFEVGSVPITANQTMTMGAMHRTGNDPIIGGSIQAREDFLFLTFTRTTLKAK
jgi:hypothetical protein